MVLCLGLSRSGLRTQPNLLDGRIPEAAGALAQFHFQRLFERLGNLLVDVVLCRLPSKQLLQILLAAPKPETDPAPATVDERMSEPTSR